jgi:hypothetical protein
MRVLAVLVVNIKCENVKEWKEGRKKTHSSIVNCEAFELFLP